MFRGSIKIGKILGIPIRLDYSWFIIFLLLTYQLANIGTLGMGIYLENTYFRYLISAITAVLLFASVLLHELGHSYIALRKGIPIRSITLFIFGGVAEITQEPRTATDEFEIAVAGPLVSVAIAAICWSLYTLNPILYLPDWLFFILYFLAQVNTAIIIFNLIPGFPLDGGRIFRAFLWKFSNNLKKATRISAFIGQGFGFFLIFLGILGFVLNRLNPVNGIFMVFIGIFLVQAAQSSYQQVLVRAALSGIKVKEVMTNPVTSVHSWLTIEELINDYFLRYRYSSFPVIDDGTLKGMVTIYDAKQIPKLSWLNYRVMDIMKPVDENQLVSEDADAVDALTKMIRKDIHKLIVTRNQHVIGIVTLPDLMSLFKIKTDLGE